jgi:hypothetical protein
METSIAAPVPQQDVAFISTLQQASLPYVGRWNRLVSTTNWEKGRIICQWRDVLADAGAPPSQFSDEAWSRLVGGVTGQHVGRLRRVYLRFGQVYDKYDGLYWSHFQAALDWGDAEMWLEGAGVSHWSVSQMRDQRSQTLGDVAGAQHEPADEVADDLDEDFEPAANDDSLCRAISPALEEVQAGPRPEGPDFGDEGAGRDGSRNGARGEGRGLDSGDEPTEHVQPFANLPDLPDDLAEAFESYKLAILRHKADSWRQISRDDVLGSLDALKQLALAPSAE